MQDTIDIYTDLTADELAEWVEFHEQAAQRAEKDARFAAAYAAEAAELWATDHPARVHANENAEWAAGIAAKWAGRLEVSKRAAAATGTR